MSKPSNAEDYFRKITAQGNPCGYLEALTLIPEVETEWLEFKGCDKIAEADILKYWSKSLSGFGNTAGGVLIWGIDARKNSEGIDCANCLALAPDADWLAQRLSDVLLNSVVPPLRGVEIKSYKRSGKEGFVVCLIPEGAAKAHRAEGASRQFYMRMQDNFDVPPVAVIRSLFFPQASAYLVPSIWINPRNVEPNRYNPLQFVFCLRNTGTLTARNIFLSIHHPKSFHFGASQTGKTHDPTVLHENIPLTVKDAINPQMPLDGIFALHTDDVTSLQDGFEFRIKTSCEDSPVMEWKRFMSHYDFLKPQKLEFTLISD